MSVRYVCVKPGCWNLTSEVWCLGHRLEHEAKKASKNFIEDLEQTGVSDGGEDRP